MFPRLRLRELATGGAAPDDDPVRVWRLLQQILIRTTAVVIRIELLRRAIASCLQLSIGIERVSQGPLLWNAH